MNYRLVPKKATVFKIFYLVFSLLVVAYTAYILIANIISGVKEGVGFDETVFLIATLLIKSCGSVRSG